jgi:hypothetical protein
MFTGQVEIISNRATWLSDFYQFVDEDTDTVLNILNQSIGFDCSVYIKDEHHCQVALATIANGQVIASASDVVNEPGIQWTFTVANLSALCAGTYLCGVKVTANGQISDVILGTIAVVEGN